MAEPFKLKQNDTRPIYIAQLMENVGLAGPNLVGTPVDLTTATSVRFLMRLAEATQDDPPKVNAAADIVTPLTGIISYEWQPADTDEVGTFNVEFEITWNDGGIETIPNDDYNQVVITYDLGDAP